MNNDTPLVKRAYNLGLKAVPNFTALSEQQITYYESHLDELPLAVTRGFVLPESKEGKEDSPAKPRSIFQHLPDLDKHDFPGMDAFAVDAFYKVNLEDENAKVKFSCIGQNFENWFYGMKVKATKPSKLTLDKLISSSYDKDIISEINEKYCDLSLGEVRWLLESGLLQEGHWYACYVKDNEFVRRAVYWDWRGTGWGVEAYLVSNTSSWIKGHEFVSRKRLAA